MPPTSDAIRAAELGRERAVWGVLTDRLSVDVYSMVGTYQVQIGVTELLDRTKSRVERRTYLTASFEAPQCGHVECVLMDLADAIFQRACQLWDATREAGDDLGCRPPALGEEPDPSAPACRIVVATPEGTSVGGGGRGLG
jgi:hypothetical protein